MTKSLEEEEEKEEEGIDEANTFLYTVYLKLKKISVHWSSEASGSRIMYNNR